MKLFLYLIIILSPFSIFAQNVYQEISSETCFCISQYPVDIFTTDSLAKYTSLCLFESATMYQKKLKTKKYDFDLKEEFSVLKLSNIVNPILQENCPLISQTEDKIKEFNAKQNNYLSLLINDIAIQSQAQKIFKGQFLELNKVDKKTQKLTLLDKTGSYQEFILPFSYQINSDLLQPQKENIRVVYFEQENKNKIKTKTILSIKLSYRYP